MDANTTDREIVLALSKEIGAEMSNYDLDIVHRLKVKNGIPPIIVRFTSYQAKQRLYKVKKNCRDKDWSSVLGDSMRIYINENLTRRRAQLFKKAREAVKSKQLAGCWTIDGKIFAKKSMGSYPVQIHKEEDIMKME